MATYKGSFGTPCLVHDCFGRLLADGGVLTSFKIYEHGTYTESLNMHVEKTLKIPKDEG